MGAFLWMSGSHQWLAGHVPSAVSSQLASRKTQIFPFEVLAATVAIIKWGPALAGRRVAFFVANIAARGSLASGRSSKADVNAVVGLVWRLAIKYRISMFFIWVPSALNIADGPSRGEAISWAQRVPLDVRWEVVSQALSCG